MWINKRRILELTGIDLTRVENAIYRFSSPLRLQSSFFFKVRLNSRSSRSRKIINKTRLDFNERSLIKVSLSFDVSNIFDEEEKEKEKENDVQTWFSSGTATRGETSRTPSPIPRPGNRQEVHRVSGNYIGNILPDRWMEWWLDEILEATGTVPCLHRDEGRGSG